MLRIAIILALAAGATTPFERSLACDTCGCRIAECLPAILQAFETGQEGTQTEGAGADALPIEPGSWTLVVMPDTQHYSESYPTHFFNQTQWIADHAVSHNIKYVLHEGDIVNVNTQPQQWVNARAALDTLNGVVPYALAPGNHDYGPGGNSSTRDTRFHNPENFGPGTPYATQPSIGTNPSIGGFFEAGKTDNSYHTWSAGGQDWLALALEFGPRDEVVAWANDVVEAHPDHNAILVTHAYMYFDDTIYDWATKGSSQSWNPHSYGVANQPGGVNDGQELWDNLVKLHDNFRFAFNGHVLGDGTGRRSTLGDGDNVVHQILANYQMNTQGGQGDMRLLEFKADGETVVVRTYSPSLDRYNTAADQEFTLNMNQLPVAPPAIPHAVTANLIAAGPTDPAANTVDSVTIPQTSAPGVSTGQLNRGDFQVRVGGSGLVYTDGILLASVTQHSRPDFIHTPSGIPRRATVEAGRNPFGDGYLSLSIMEAGSGAVAPDNEVNFDTSVAWFEFGAGWQGAHVNADGTLVAANKVSQPMVTRTAVGRYQVDLDVNSSNDGLLFAIGNNNDNIVVQTGPFNDGSAWDIRVEDNATNFGATGEDRDWSFLYLPYNTEEMVGGLYDGAANAHISSVGDFTMNRLATGQYELTIPGESPTTGMLITTVSFRTTASGTTAPDDNVITYEAGPGGTFLINSYDLPVVPLALQDTRFSWAFISFDDPIAPFFPPGDFNRDGVVDNGDLLTWRSQFKMSGESLSADGNGDGIVDAADYVVWRRYLAAGSGAGSGAPAVPEPRCLCLVLSALWGTFVARFRRPLPLSTRL